MKKKKALITGIAGQDGSYLSELLLSKGYEIFGIIPRRSTPETQTLRIDHILNDLVLEYGDVLDLASIYRAINMIKPDEIYHLAAQSHVQISFYEPMHTTSVDALGTLNMLEAMAEFVPKARFYNAASSEIFGNTPDYPITENSRMRPCSPYAAAKLYAYHITNIYRVSKKLFAVNGILFNHESPRRGLNFVTAKVVKGALDIKYGNKNELQLGNLDSSRDWGHAKDYVYAMWLMLQNDKPNDYLVATGKETTIRKLCEYVFNNLKLGDYKKYVKTVDKYCRPYELAHLKGDPTKIKKELGWEPKYSFENMIDEMIIEIKKKFYPEK